MDPQATFLMQINALLQCHVMVPTFTERVDAIVYVVARSQLTLGRCVMMKIRNAIAPLFVVGLLVSTSSAMAHCDSVDGPVARAVQKALESGNINPVLAYAPATAEAEIKAAFEQSRKVRGLNPEARALADKAFLETTIRLHRAGEGAAYTGLKPAGIDYGPVIPAAETAVETGDISKLQAALMEEINHALNERLTHVRDLQKAPVEPQSEGEVAAARKRISAELGFVTFAETLRRAALGEGAHQHVD